MKPRCSSYGHASSPLSYMNPRWALTADRHGLTYTTPVTFGGGKRLLENHLDG